METKDRGAMRALIEASVEFPLALQNWMFGMNSDEREVEHAAVKTFQAWSRLANQSMERIFADDGFAGLMVGSVKNWVQLQRLARDFIGSLAPEAGDSKSETPTAEIAELRASVISLRKDVRGLTARLNVAKEPAADAVHTNGAQAA